MKGGGFIGVARGNCGSTSAAPPVATSRSTFSKQHRPKDLSILQSDIHLIEIKYCEDTRPQNQLRAAQEQHKGLCSILHGASVTLHTILLELGGTIHNNHTLEPFPELGLDSERGKSNRLLAAGLLLGTLVISRFSQPRETRAGASWL